MGGEVEVCERVGAYEDRRCLWPGQSWYVDVTFLFSTKLVDFIFLIILVKLLKILM